MSALRAYRRLLRNARLTRLLAGEFISSIGDWLYLVALLVLVYAETGDPLLLGIVGAARIVPFAILSVPAGIVADRFDRRWILIVTDVLRGLLMVVLAILVAAEAPVLAIIVTAIAAACASAFFGPALMAYLPSVVDDEADLGPANSAYAILAELAFIIGPAVAGLLIVVGGLAIAFLLNAFSFFVVALVLVTLPKGATARDASSGEEAGAVAETGAGRSPAADWRSLLAVVGGPVLMDLATSFAGGGISVLTVLVAVDLLGAGDAATGYLNAATGVGGIVAGLLAGALLLRRMDVPLFGAAILTAAGFAILGASRELGLAMTSIALAVAGLALIDIINVTLLQRAVPDQLRGRALGLVQTVGTIAAISGSLALPVLAAALGIPLALAITGLVVAGLTLCGVVVLRRTDALAAPLVDRVGVELLQRSFFGALPPARLEAAARHLRPLTVHAGTVVVEQGAVADRFYIIESGRYEVSQLGSDGQARSLRHLGPNEVFGEIGLLTASGRTATVRAETDGQLWSLERRPFLELVSTGPGLTTGLLDLYRGAGGVRG